MPGTKICIITTVHPPLDTRIFYKQAKSLVKAGYRVVLIAQSDEEKIVDGIKIVPISKPKNRLVRMVILSWQAYKRAKNLNAEIYHFHDPELIPIALLLKASKGKVIYDVHEDVPEQILSKEWIWKPFRVLIAKLFNFAEKKAACFFNAVISATPAIADKFIGKKNNVYVIQNFPLLDELIAKNDNNSEKFMQGNQIEANNFVVYVGGITLIRGAKEMIEAVSLLPESYEVKLVLGGRFDPPTLESEISKHSGWERTEYMGWLNRKQVAEVLTRASAGLVLFHPVPNHINSQPNKMFEYMAAGLPVIASHFDLWKDIINGNKCGLTIDPNDPEQISGAVKYIFDNPEEAKHMGNRGRKAVERIYNWNVEEEKLLSLYHEVLN